MAQIIKLNVDTRGFDDALKKYAKRVKLGGDTVVNTAAMYLAAFAARETHHADREKISSLKYAKWIEIARPTKTGKRRLLKDFNKLSKSQQERRTQYEATTLALAYYLGKKDGGRPMSLRGRGINPKKFSDRAALMKGALRMVNKRISSVNWLRSGWIPAIKKLRAAIDNAPSVEELPFMKKGWGGAIVSINGRHKAEIYNKSLTNFGGKFSEALLKFGEDGLRAALQTSENRLRWLTARMLGEAGKEFNSK